jgi:uncharacterized OB-fold protein
MAEEKKIPVVQCASCSAVAIPPQYVCRKCGDTHFTETEISGKAKIYTHTTIRIASEAFQSQAPFDLAVVDLDHDIRVTARVERKENEGIAVEDDVIFDRLEDDVYWFKTAL